MSSPNTLHFEKCLNLPVSAEEAFAWHARAGAFDRLTPPWMQTEIIQDSQGIESGSRLMFRVRRGPLWIRWIAEHQGTVEGRRFVDLQIAGPFAYWRHVHAFESTESGARLRDSIEYALPFGALSHPLMGNFFEKDLERMFGYRHRITFDDLELHRRQAQFPRLHVAITGDEDWKARPVAALMSTGGHHVQLWRSGRARRAYEIEIGREPASLDQAEVWIDLGSTSDKLPDLTMSPRVVLLVLPRTTDPKTEERRIAAWRQRCGDTTRLRVLRVGEVLSPAGGWLAREITWRDRLSPERLRRQRAPEAWISIDDFAAGLLHLALHHASGDVPSAEPIELSASPNLSAATGFEPRHLDFVSVLEHFFA